MPTKYILHGGHAPNQPNKREFFEEMVRDITKKEVTIVYVPFAKKSKEDQEKYYKINKKSCLDALTNKHVSFLMASENPEKFLDQVHQADVIYLGGGNDELLKSFLELIPLSVLVQHIDGKVIAGSSAGANVLTKYYFTNHRQRVEEGLGILPIKTICHYTQDKEPLLERLEAYKEHLTSFALPEDYFVVIQ